MDDGVQFTSLARRDIEVDTPTYLVYGSFPRLTGTETQMLQMAYPCLASVDSFDTAYVVPLAAQKLGKQVGMTEAFAHISYRACSWGISFGMNDSFHIPKHYRSGVVLGRREMGHKQPPQYYLLGFWSWDLGVRQDTLLSIWDFRKNLLDLEVMKAKNGARVAYTMATLAVGSVVAVVVAAATLGLIAALLASTPLLLALYTLKRHGIKLQLHALRHYRKCQWELARFLKEAPKEQLRRDKLVELDFDKPAVAA